MSGWVGGWVGRWVMEGRGGRGGWNEVLWGMGGWVGGEMEELEDDVDALVVSRVGGLGGGVG